MSYIYAFIFKYRNARAVDGWLDSRDCPTDEERMTRGKIPITARNRPEVAVLPTKSASQRCPHIRWYKNGRTFVLGTYYYMMFFVTLSLCLSLLSLFLSLFPSHVLTHSCSFFLPSPSRFLPSRSLPCYPFFSFLLPLGDFSPGNMLLFLYPNTTPGYILPLYLVFLHT